MLSHIQAALLLLPIFFARCRSASAPTPTGGYGSAPSAAFTNEWPSNLSPCDSYKVEWLAGPGVVRPFSIRSWQAVKNGYPSILDTVGGPFPDGDCYVFQPKSSYVGSQISFQLLDHQQTVMDSGPKIDIGSCSTTTEDAPPPITSSTQQPDTSPGSVTTTKPSPDASTPGSESTPAPDGSARSDSSSSILTSSTSGSAPSSSSAISGTPTGSNQSTESSALSSSGSSQTQLIENGTTISPGTSPTASSVPGSLGKHGLSTGAIVGVVLGALGLVVGLVFALMHCRKRTNRNTLSQESLYRVEPLEPLMTQLEGSSEQLTTSRSFGLGKRERMMAVGSPSQDAETPHPWISAKHHMHFDPWRALPLDRPTSLNGLPRRYPAQAPTPTQDNTTGDELDSRSLDDDALPSIGDPTVAARRRFYSRSDPGNDTTGNGNEAGQEEVQGRLEAQNEQLRREIALLRAMGRYSLQSTQPPYTPREPPDYHTLEQD